MGQDIAEVQVDDFTAITLNPLPHREIENTLCEIGGGGVDGANYKLLVLKKAGWKGNKLTSFAKDPESAAEAFNKIRQVLAKTSDPAELEKQLESYV